MTQPKDDPHGGMPVASTGVPLAAASAALILVHGRGGSADDILSLGPVLAQGVAGADRLAILAPQARGNSWYPFSFLAPMERNEPGLTSGIGAIHAVISAAVVAGIPRERVVLGGFSQGACLSMEYAARHATRYGGLLAFSGGLIGPHGTPRDYGGTLAGTPVFLGCSDVDPHIPVERVEETAEVLGGLGGQEDRRLYPGMGHTINEDEIEAGREILRGVLARE
jgi:predicted esterase